MPEKIDVLDEWGNKMGEFIPTGGQDGWIIFLVIIILLLAFAVIAIPIYLVLKGLKLWGQNKKDQAIFCFLAVSLMVGIPFFIQVQQTLERKALAQAQEVRVLALQEEMTEVTEALPQTVAISNVRLETPSEHQLILYFRVINHNRMTIYVDVHGGYPVLFYFVGGEKVKTYHLDFRGGGFIEPGASQEERQKYGYWSEKGGKVLESFCVPTRVIRRTCCGLYESGELQYICKEIVYKVVP